MNELGNLSDQEKFKALGVLSATTLGMALQAMRVLAVRGLLHPDEADDYVSGVLRSLDALPELSPSMPDSVRKTISELKRLAASNWKGND